MMAVMVAIGGNVMVVIVIMLVGVAGFWCCGCVWRAPLFRTASISLPLYLEMIELTADSSLRFREPQP